MVAVLVRTRALVLSKTLHALFYRMSILLDVAEHSFKKEFFFRILA